MKKVLKKIFVIFIVCMFFVQTSFGYKLNKKDEKLLKIFYVKIDKIYKKNPNKVKNFYTALKNLRKKYKYKKNKIRFYFLTGELEKYLEIKLKIKKTNYNKQNFLLSKPNLVDPKKIKKVENKQDNEQEILQEKNKKTKKQKRKIKKISDLEKLLESKKRYRNKKEKKVLKTTFKNGVLVKYVKKEKKEYIPKNTNKFLTPEIQNKFFVKKILYNNFLVINYYKELKIFKISGIEDYFCNEKKLNNFLKNNLENKKIFLDNIKKKNKNLFKAEIYLNGENLAKKIIKEKICIIKK